MKYLVTSNELTSIANAVRNCYNISTSLSFPTDFQLGQEIDDSLIELLENRLSNNITISRNIIPSYFFAYCTNISSINFTGTIIRNLAFENCYNLITINAPQCLSIGNSICIDCENLENANFPLVSYFYGTFQHCSKLKSVNLSEAITLTSTFLGCYALESINAPKVTTIYAQTFYKCWSLKTLNLPKVEQINAQCFVECSNLTSISFPKCTSIYGYSAFALCENLTSVNFPTLTTLSGSYIFDCCYNLSDISMPVLEIFSGTRIFRSCSNLKTFHIPSTCLQVSGTSHFLSCGIESLFIEGSNRRLVVTANLSNVFGPPFSTTGSAKIYVPASLVSVYLSANYWNALGSERILPIPTDGIPSDEPIEEPIFG